MTDGQALLTLIAGALVLAFAPAVIVLWEMRREARGYEAMARSMRRMKDEDPDALRVVGRAFKDTFK